MFKQKKGENMKYLLLLVLSVSFVFATIDVNNTTKKELMDLKGIGVKKAEAILAYRKEHCFKNVHDLVAVKGIGEKFMVKHKSELTAGSCGR